MSHAQLEEGLLIIFIIVCCFLTFGFALLMSKKMEKDIMEEREIRDRMVEKYGYAAINQDRGFHPL